MSFFTADSQILFYITGILFPKELICESAVKYTHVLYTGNHLLHWILNPDSALGIYCT